MTELQWWPSFLMDEAIPPGKASPDGYIRHPVDDGWYVAGDPEIEEDMPELSEIVKPGDIVDFHSCRRLGRVHARVVNSEGKYTVELADAIPEGCNTLSWGLEVIAGDFEELAEALAEEEDWHHFDVLAIDCAEWTENIPFRLEVAKEGEAKPRFVRVTTVEGSGTA